MLLLLPLFLGTLSVFQNTLNRQIGLRHGLAFAMLMNAAMLVIGSILLFASTKVWPMRFDPFYRVSGLGLRWWYIFPGFMGFVIVSCLPFVMDRFGALNVFVGFVAAQIVTSLLWDFALDGISLTLPRVLGAALSIMAVLLVSWR